MQKVKEAFDHTGGAPSHELDAHFVFNSRSGAMCGLKLWLPIDCHDDARIEISGSGLPGPTGFLPDGERHGLRLVSEQGPYPGFLFDASDVSIRSISSNPTLLVDGTRISVSHVGRLRLSTAIKSEVEPLTDDAKLEGVWFRLSDLRYGGPDTMPVVDSQGSRKVYVSGVKKLRLWTAGGMFEMELHRHWKWMHCKHGRVVAGSSPVLELKVDERHAWGSIGCVEEAGRDACMLLTLAARHLTVVHVISASLEDRVVEDWLYPFNRQRSTTEEDSAGPLIDEDGLEEFFGLTSQKWAALSQNRRNAIRQAVYAIHPFAQTSIEGHFLQMFYAVEALSRAWFPGLHKTRAKIAALLEEFRPHVAGVWPVTASTRDGLDEVRNDLAHGYPVRPGRTRLVVAASEHLHVWLERVLLSVLGIHFQESRRDWLSRHVQALAPEVSVLREELRRTRPRKGEVPAAP